MFKLRLIPVLIVTCCLVLVMKLASINQDYHAWHEFAVQPAYAESKAEESHDEAAAEEAHEEDAGDAHALDEKTEAAMAAEDEDEEEEFDHKDLTSQEIEILQQLGERREELETRERDILKREALLRVTEQRIEAKLDELNTIKSEIEKLRQDIDGLVNKNSDQEEENLKKLVSLYEKMKPQNAATIFNELDISILVDIMARMKESKTAPILANMNPMKAKTVTTLLAQKQALPALGE